MKLGNVAILIGKEMVSCVPVSLHMCKNITQSVALAWQKY